MLTLAQADFFKILDKILLLMCFFFWIFYKWYKIESLEKHEQVFSQV